jgi:hypothetical protein
METFGDDRDRDFERHVVMRVIKHAAGTLPAVDPRRARLVVPTGSEPVTLTWFRETYPRFPIRLGAVLLPSREPLPWEDFFRRFTKTAYFVAYQRWCAAETLDDRRDRVGIAFNCQGMAVVLHNWDGPRKVDTCRLVHAIGRPPVTLVVEPLERLLTAIGFNWIMSL